MTKFGYVAGALAALSCASALSSPVAAKTKPSLMSMPESQQRTALAKGFRTLDKDRSGFVEQGEAPYTMVRDTKGGPLRKVTNGAPWINRYDTNGDGKVSSSEYVDGTIKALRSMGPNGKVCVGGSCNKSR